MPADTKTVVINVTTPPAPAPKGFSDYISSWDAKPDKSEYNPEETVTVRVTFTPKTACDYMVVIKDSLGNTVASTPWKSKLTGGVQYEEDLKFKAPSEPGTYNYTVAFYVDDYGSHTGVPIMKSEANPYAVVE